VKRSDIVGGAAHGSKTHFETGLNVTIKMSFSANMIEQQEGPQLRIGQQVSQDTTATSSSTTLAALPNGASCFAHPYLTQS
jgi:hypothetical protein